MRPTFLRTCPPTGLLFVVIAVIGVLGGTACSFHSRGPRMQLSERGYVRGPGNVQILSPRMEMRPCQEGEREIPSCSYAVLQLAVVAEPGRFRKSAGCPEQAPYALDLSFSMTKWNPAEGGWRPWGERSDGRAEIRPRGKHTSFGLGEGTSVDPNQAQQESVAPGEDARQIGNVELLEHPEAHGPMQVNVGVVCASSVTDRVLNADLMLHDPSLQSGSAYQLWIWSGTIDPSTVHPEELKVVTSIWLLSWFIGLSGIAGFMIIGGLL
jgi:hypothetical protein